MMTIRWRFSTIMAIAILLVAHDGYGQPSRGQTAPVFSLKDLQGATYDLSRVKSPSLVVLYFFDVESKTNSEDLAILDSVIKEQRKQELQARENGPLVVWAISGATEEKLREWAMTSQFEVPILPDTQAVSETYCAISNFPAVYLLGPSLQVLDIFKGPAPDSSAMLLQLAQRLLRLQPGLAKALAVQVEQKMPANFQAVAVKGYAAIETGALAEAQETFEGLAKGSGTAGIVGKEGLMMVAAQKGDMQLAHKFANELKSAASDRAASYVVMADSLFGRGQQHQALVEFEKAVKAKAGALWSQSMARARLGRAYASLGQYRKAQDSFDKALALDPYFEEAMVNKGAALEKQGYWVEALAAYQKAMELNAKDFYARALMDRAQDTLARERDVLRRDGLEEEVKDALSRYRNRAEAPVSMEQGWTPQYRTIVLLGRPEEGLLSGRDGIPAAFFSSLSRYLNNSHRVKVVDPFVVERLINALGPVTFNRATLDATTKLGNALKAGFVGEASFYHSQDKTVLNISLMDLQSGTVPRIFSMPLLQDTALEAQIESIGRQMLTTIVLRHPLRGYLLWGREEKPKIDIGLDQGVAKGSRFEVLVGQEYDDLRPLGVRRSAIARVGLLEVVSVNRKESYVRILSADGQLPDRARVQEMVDDLQAR